MNIGTDLVARARLQAIQAHARINQRRKYTLQPYDIHLKAVADLVATVSDDPEMIAAAWLHDAVEDTPATFEELEGEFGAAVKALVMELTDVSRPSDGNRAVRKAIDRQHIATISPRAKTIKLADVIDNTRDICKHDERFARVYLTEMMALLEVLQEGDATLLAKARKIVAECGRKLGMDGKTIVPDVMMPIEFSAIESSVFARYRGIRVFATAFTARDVLEPLCSFDEGTSVASMRSACAERDLAVVGLRRGGSVVGYLRREDLADASPSPSPRPFVAHQLVEFESSLADVVHVLTSYAFCFVRLGEEVVATIGRADMEKPVVRMWLFGMITVFEMSMVEFIRSRWPGQTWRTLVSPARLEKAEQLLQERERRNQGGDLLDCLQFSDKAQIALEEQGFLEELGFLSKKTAKGAIKDLESLRNNLAHAQDITRHDWAQIARMTRRVQLMVGR